MSPAQRARVLLSQPAPLFAVMDAAQSPSVLGLLGVHSVPYECLYSGRSAQSLKGVAPYLVPLAGQYTPLEALLAEGADKSWGIYLTANASPDALRKHLRKFLLASLPDGKEVLFRFYDPRVFLPYFQASSSEERDQLLGPIQTVWVEIKGRWVELHREPV